MAEVKKFYWLKLQKDFFRRHDIRIIESMQNGKDYILFYMKLLVESISHEGALRFSDTIPYNDEMLATITNTNIDIVRSAIKIFTQLNLMEILDDGTIYMFEVQRMIGGETEWAEKKRIYRENQKLPKETIKGQEKTMSDKSKSKIKSKSKSIELDKNNTSFQKQVFEYWVDKSSTSNALTKHTKITKDMDNALLSIKKLYTVEKAKELIDRFCIVYEEKINTDYPLKKRTLQEFFGQKAYQSKSLICQEFDDEGCKWINHQEDEPIDYFEMLRKAEEERRRASNG